MGQSGGPQFSPDGRWFWDGYRWVATRSSPGRLSQGSLALIAGATLLVTLVASVSIPLLLYFTRKDSTHSIAALSPSPSPFTSIPCDQLEYTQVHYHAYLQILFQGDAVSIPTDVGRKQGCFYWLHMHTNESGIIHVEAPDNRAFTLGDFFAVWSDWAGQAQPLDSTHVSTLTLGAGQKLAVYVDLDGGAGATPFTGDPRSIVLKNHEVITLEVTPPAVTPPPSFTWPPGF